MLRLKPWSAMGASHHSAFMSSWLTTIHTTLASSTQWMSSPSRKWERGFSLRYHLVVFVFGVNQERWEAGGVQDFQHQW